MARNTYAAEIGAIFKGLNESKRTKADDRYRQQVLSETIRNNKEQESIQRETLTNRLNIAGAYSDRADDTTRDLDKKLDVQRYGIKSTYDVGMNRNFTTRRGQDINKDISYRGQDVTMRGQDITSGIAKMRDRTVQRGQNFNLDLGLRRDDTTRRGQGLNFDLGLLGNYTQRRGQDLTYGLGTKKIDAAKDMQQAGFDHDKDKMAYDRETKEIMLNRSLSSTEKINALNNLTKVTIQNMGDLTKKEIQDMSLQERREMIDAQYKREDVQRDQAIKGSAAQPMTFERKEGFFGVDEDGTLANIKSWDMSQTMGDAKNPSVYSKAVTLAKSKDSSFTNQVIANYEDAWKKVNAEDMWQVNLRLAPYKKKHDAQNAMIKTRLRGLYSAQGYKKEWIDSKLKDLKSLNLRSGKSPYKY